MPTEPNATPLKVAIDGNEANCLNRVGSNAYAYYLLQAVAKITADPRRGFDLTILLDSPPLPDMPMPRAGLTYKVITPAKLWTQFALPLHLFLHADDYDVFFTPGHYAPRFSRVPYISSVMDLAFLAYPKLFRPRDLFKLENWTRYSVRAAAKVVAISQFTKNEIVNYYQKPSEDIIVIPPALSSNLPQLDAKLGQNLLLELGISQRYFLYLGTLQPRKNILRLLQAFEIFLSNATPGSPASHTLLVLAGKNGWLTDEIDRALANCRFRDQIILTGFVDEKQKAALLANAIATCNLGIYEGFGIPVLESLAYCTVPIFANNSAMNEVAGAAGFGVNPFRVNRIVKALTQAANLTATQKKQFAQLASAQLQKYSYEKSAQLLLTQLDRITQPPGSDVG